MALTSRSHHPSFLPITGAARPESLTLHLPLSRILMTCHAHQGPAPPPRSSGSSARYHLPRRKSPRCFPRVPCGLRSYPCATIWGIIPLTVGDYRCYNLARFTADLTAPSTGPFLGGSMHALMIRSALASAVVKITVLASKNKKEASHTSSCISDTVADRCSSSCANLLCSFIIRCVAHQPLGFASSLLLLSPEAYLNSSVGRRRYITLVTLHLFTVYSTSTSHTTCLALHPSTSAMA